jgi:uncharacterized protein YegP (UPF0339 family)
MKTQLTIVAASFAFLFSACDGTMPQEGPIGVEDLTEGKEDGVRTAKFETFVGHDGQTYFHLLAGNGEMVLRSQGYARLKDAEAGIATVRFNGAQTDAYQVLESKDGQYYFNLLAGNWEVIGSSELYVSQSNATRAVDTIAGLVSKATFGKAAAGAKFQVFQGLDGQYYFHLRASNGEIVLQSEGYTRKASATSSIDSVRTNGVDARRYKIKDAANGQAYFVLTATNNKVIAQSEPYSSRSAAQVAASNVESLLQSL